MLNRASGNTCLGHKIFGNKDDNHERNNFYAYSDFSQEKYDQDNTRGSTNPFSRQQIYGYQREQSPRQFMQNGFKGMPITEAFELQQSSYGKSRGRSPTRKSWGTNYNNWIRYGSSSREPQPDKYYNRLPRARSYNKHGLNKSESRAKILQKIYRDPIEKEALWSARNCQQCKVDEHSTVYCPSLYCERCRHNGKHSTRNICRLVGLRTALNNEILGTRKPINTSLTTSENEKNSSKGNKYPKLKLS